MAQISIIPTAPDPNLDIIAALESHLQEAREGNLVTFAIATVRRDHARGLSWITSDTYGNDLAAAILQLLCSYGNLLSFSAEAPKL